MGAINLNESFDLVKSGGECAVTRKLTFGGFPASGAAQTWMKRRGDAVGKKCGVGVYESRPNELLITLSNFKKAFRRPPDTAE